MIVPTTLPWCCSYMYIDSTVTLLMAEKMHIDSTVTLSTAEEMHIDSKVKHPTVKWITEPFCFHVHQFCLGN